MTGNISQSRPWSCDSPCLVFSQHMGCAEIGSWRACRGGRPCRSVPQSFCRASAVSDHLECIGTTARLVGEHESPCKRRPQRAPGHITIHTHREVRFLQKLPECMLLGWKPHEWQRVNSILAHTRSCFQVWANSLLNQRSSWPYLSRPVVWFFNQIFRRPGVARSFVAVVGSKSPAA